MSSMMVRAEYWGHFCFPSILWFSYWDRQPSCTQRVAWLQGQDEKGVPLSFVTECDLLATIRSVLRLRGYDTVKVSDVKGHADQFIVAVNPSFRNTYLIGTRQLCWECWHCS